MPKSKAAPKPHVKTPALPIMLDRERHLRIDLNALARLDKALGGNAAVDVSKRMASTGLCASDALAILWAGLASEDPDLTLETVGEWVDGTNINEVIKIVMAAWSGGELPKADPPADPPMESSLPTG